MNDYTYDDLEVGHEESFSVDVTDEMMRLFLAITGDDNPLHSSREYAAERGYRSRVAYGMLTASFCSTLAGVYLPGRLSLIHSCSVEFPKPVFPGDRLTVKGTVSNREDAFGTIDIKVVMTNQDGEKVCRGKMRVGFTNDNPERSQYLR